MSSGTDKRRNILEEVVKCVCQDRQNTYGDAEDNFANIAVRWQQYIRERFRVNLPLESFDVAGMMIELKLSRLTANPLHRDNWVDGAGYFVCGGGITTVATPVEADEYSYDFNNTQPVKSNIR